MRPTCQIIGCKKWCQQKYVRGKVRFYTQCKPHRKQHKGLFDATGKLKCSKSAALFVKPSSDEDTIHAIVRS